MLFGHKKAKNDTFLIFLKMYYLSSMSRWLYVMDVLYIFY